MNNRLILPDPLLAFPDWLRMGAGMLAERESLLPPGMFAPGWDLDLDDPGARVMLQTPPIRISACDFEGKPFGLLDLMTVDGVRTTKAWSSLLMVARAVAHVCAFGESVLLVTPTSGNKGSALRYAVGKAVTAGVVEPSQLRIACLVPRGSAKKTWHGALSLAPRLAELNPLFVCDLDQPAEVKRLALEACRAAQPSLAASDTRIWYTLDVRNYHLGDMFRAFAESRLQPPASRRVHVHAVSSAFGLLGYEFGRTVLKRAGREDEAPEPSFLIVQHLRTPDMVLHWEHGSFDRGKLPRYRPAPGTGGVTQHENRRYPELAESADEEIDPTFYTREPATAAAMTSLLRERGGGGIVVSKHDCAQMYGRVRALCALLGITLPEDIGSLRELSLVMATTGALIARDRGFIDPGEEVFIHASGSYGREDYQPVPESQWQIVSHAGDVARRLVLSASAGALA